MKKLNPQNIAAAGILAAFALLNGGYNLLNLYTFNFTHAAQDQTIFLQVAYSFVHHFNFAESIYHSTNFLGDQHFTPAFAFLGALAPFIPNELIVAFCPLIALAICGLVAYLAAKDILGGTWPPLLVLALSLFNPAAFYLSEHGVRETLLAAPALALALHFFRKDNFTRFAICCLAACLCKEDIPLIVAGFALPALLGKRRLRWVISPPVFGIGVFVLIRLVIMPALAGNPLQIGVGFEHFNEMGNNIGDIAGFIFTHPLQTIARLLGRENLEFFAQLFGSFWFLPLLTPEILLVPLSQFLEIGLSASKHTADMRNWYYAPIYPFMAISLVYGYRRIAHLCDWLVAKYLSFARHPASIRKCRGDLLLHRFELTVSRISDLSKAGKSFVTTVLTFLLVTSTLLPITRTIANPYSFQGVFINTNPPSIDAQLAHYFHYLNYFRFFYLYFDEIKEELDIIEDDASVCAQYPFLIHLAWRERLTQFPDIADAQYVVLHPWLERYPLGNDEEEYYRTIDRLYDQGYRAVADKNGLLILSKGKETDQAERFGCGRGCREYEAEYLPLGIAGDRQNLHLYNDSNRIDKSSSGLAGRRATLRHDYVIRNWQPPTPDGFRQMALRIKFSKVYPGSGYLLRLEALDPSGERLAEMLIGENDVICDNEYRTFYWNLPASIGSRQTTINLLDTHRASYLIDTVRIIEYPETATDTAAR